MSQRIGRYEIVERLGAGNMGEVFRGRAAGGPDVAIKLVKNAEMKPKRLARFQREGELSARMEHPAIVQLIENGSHVGCPYLVYELVPGARPITQAFEDLTRDERVELVAEAARGLGHAHRLGILHRDVKPDNILVDANGRVRVADFGLAYAQDVERLTRSGMTVGTPLYMSPEHLTGKGLCAASDVWGLGLVLYEALAGACPIHGDTLQSVVDQVLKGEIRPPQALDSSVPAALQAVCLKALARKTQGRYPHGDALAEALDEALAGPGSREASSPPAPQQGRGLLLAGAGLATILLGAVVLVIALTPAAAPPPLPPAGDVTPQPPVDRTPPEVSLATPAEGVVTAEATLVVEGQVQDPSGPVTVALEGRTVACEGGTFRTEWELLPGTQELTLRAEDALGNKAVLKRTVTRAPAWYVALEPRRRAPLPLPEGVRFGREPGDYRNAIDGSLLRWVWVPKRTERLFRLKKLGRQVLFSQGYFMGKHEVTIDQFVRFCRDTGRKPEVKVRKGATSEHPIGWATWDEARDYCQWAGLRMPTEAEWEHAAVGTDGRTFPWGDQTVTDDLANLKETADHADGYPYTSPVGSFPAGASPFGCLDMAGNLFEWVHDHYAKKLPGNELLVDPQGPETGSEYVRKGGGYDHPALNSKSEIRYHDESTRRMEHGGFRVARSAR